MAAAGIAPRILGVGPIEAAQKVLAQNGVIIDQMDVIELNEAFASQAIATLRDLRVDPFDDSRVNPNGGAIALGTRWTCPDRGLRIRPSNNCCK